MVGELGNGFLAAVEAMVMVPVVMVPVVMVPVVMLAGW